MVVVEDPIVPDNGEIFSLSLGDQHSIERVAMFALKPPSPGRVRKRNGQSIEAQLHQIVVEFADEFRSSWKFAEPDFRRDLPGRGRADQYIVVEILNEASRLRSQQG